MDTRSLKTEYNPNEHKILLVIALFFFVNVNSQKFQKLALTPTMGWNSWNTFQTNINKDLVKETADAMVSSGMKDAGYEYLVLDDGWMAMERDSAGNPVPDPKKFPHGMKVLIDYVHSKGLKFGLYNCAGTKTCAGYPGTRGYEYQDARFYANLGIDYLKFDWCSSDGLNAKESYTTMSKAPKKQEGRLFLDFVNGDRTNAGNGQKMLASFGVQPAISQLNLMVI